VALPPDQRPAQTALDELTKLAGLRPPSGHCLVVHDRIVERDFEDPFDAALQLETDQSRCPAVEDLSCPTDSVVQVVSRNAVLDDDTVLRVDHLVG